MVGAKVGKQVTNALTDNSSVGSGISEVAGNVAAKVSGDQTKNIVNEIDETLSE